MSRFTQRVCAVTGAASGIGRALAGELATRGARLALADVDEAGLHQTAQALRARGTEVLTQALDVGDPSAVAAFAASAAGHFGQVNGIYNNAGIAFSRSVLESTVEDYERVLRVNLWGVIHGTQAFLPHLIASGDGHVVNVSSLNGYLAQAGMSHYVTTKFGVRGFTESLYAEMVRDRHPVSVHCVHPGGIATNIANAAFSSAKALGLPVTEVDERRRQIYNEKLLRMDPAQAARIVCDGVEKRRLRILVGNDARIVDALVRVAPARAPRLALLLDRRTGR